MRSVFRSAEVDDASEIGVFSSPARVWGLSMGMAVEADEDAAVLDAEAD